MKRSLGVLLVVWGLAWGCGDDSGPADDAGSDATIADTGRADTSLPDTGAMDTGAMDTGTMDTGADSDIADAPMDAEMCLDETADDTFEMATALGDIADDAGYPFDTTNGDIFPITDQDWYSWNVADELFGDVNPRAGLSALPVGVPWELCLYFDCDSDLNSVDCEGDGTPHTLVEGEIEGCCAVSTEASTSITLVPSCSGIDDGGTVYARVSRQGGEATCDGYTLTWGDA